MPWERGMFTSLQLEIEKVFCTEWIQKFDISSDSTAERHRGQEMKAPVE